MTTFLLLLVLACLISFDGIVTEKRIKKHGPEIELNPVVRYLAQKLGAFKGSALGVVLPNAIVAGFLGAFGWDIPLAYIAGVRTYLAIQQLISLKK